MAEWSHLPNAGHIDRILAHLKANPEKWSAAGDAAYYAAGIAAYSAAGAAAWDAAGDAAGVAWDAAWGAAGGAAWYAAYNAAGYAILALIAYDECAYLLNMKPDQVRVLAHLGARGAWLLLPAVIALK